METNFDSIYETGFRHKDRFIISFGVNHALGRITLICIKGETEEMLISDLSETIRGYYMVSLKKEEVFRRIASIQSRAKECQLELQIAKAELVKLQGMDI